MDKDFSQLQFLFLLHPPSPLEKEDFFFISWETFLSKNHSHSDLSSQSYVDT